MLKIEFNDTPAQDALRHLMRAVVDTRPAMLEIGERLMEVSKRSFEISASPMGVPWVPNSPVTILAYLNKISGHFAAYTRLDNKKEGSIRVGDKKGYFKKDGSLTKKSITLMANKKPLIGQSKDLSRQFSYVADAGSVTLSNSMAYAAMQQFGGSKAQFPHLWGDIPARPFMPMDASGQADAAAQKIVLDVVQFHIQNALTA